MNLKSSILFLSMLTFTIATSAQISNTLNTVYGHIEFGPKNGSWAHIYTDVPKFIFNKDVYTQGGFSSYHTNDLYLKTNGSTRITIDNSTGNVGIGTNNPQEKLHVNGHLLIPTNKRLKIGSNDPNTGSLEIVNGTCCYNTYADYKGSLIFRSEENLTGYSPITLQPNGSVLLGFHPKYNNTFYDDLGHRLLINGGILCEKIKVIADVPSSDYVFDQDYELRSLEEVKVFIETNKHLPEVPSAKEFQENGYSLGEMDDVLLRKVEELTLYIIELQERISELESNE